MKNVSKKGFTLIELMIVVVILGVLMSTIVPKLTGAQERGRDVGRKADLKNIETILNVYYSDYWQFPAAVGWEFLQSFLATPETTAENDGYVVSEIQSYFKWSKVPQDPSKGTNGVLGTAANHNGSTDATWRYWYKSLTKNGVVNNSYILCSDMEIAMNANTLLEGTNTGAVYNWGWAPTTLLIADASFEDVNDAVDAMTGTSMMKADGILATLSIYCTTY